MTKCKRRLLPAEPYEIDALESWFSDLSAEGLHVQKANALFATFIEGEKASAFPHGAEAGCYFPCFGRKPGRGTECTA